MKQIRLKILFCFCALLAVIVSTIFLFYNGYFFSSFVGLCISTYLFLETYNTMDSVLKNTEQSLAAIAKKDYSVKISQKKLTPSVFKSLNQILNINKDQDENLSRDKLIYENIIDSVDTGILILKSSGDSEIEIFFINQSFSELLEIPKFSRWDLLHPYLKTFDQYLIKENWADVKDVINLSINRNEQIYSVRTFYSKISNQDFLFVNIDPLQNIIDKKEKESWYNLMKVMSHEILNTITPINSLSNTLQILIEENGDKLGEDFDDIQKSVLTIQGRTRHLIDFVDTYRTLTELPSPVKENISIKSLVEKSLDFLSALLKEKKIETKLFIKPDNLYFNIDKKQIEQVLINLINNSIYAMEESVNPLLEIRAFQSNNKSCIEVIDNGKGIDPKIKKDIFIPFFTTRNNGSGIGLSLSKNILQAHGGHISCSSENGLTRFLLQFPV